MTNIKEKSNAKFIIKLDKKFDNPEIAQFFGLVSIKTKKKAYNQRIKCKNLKPNTKKPVNLFDKI